MKTLTINRSDANIAALDAELRSNLGEQYAGLSQKRGEIRLHLMDDASAAQIRQAEQMVIDHDPAMLTPEQEAEAARQQKLEQSRAEAEEAGVLDLSAYDGAAAEVQALARKIAWLELEIRQLRGL